MIIGAIQSNHSTCIILHCSTQGTDYLELESYEEVMGNENKIKWVNAMQDEMKSLHENISYEFIKLPNEKRALKNKWVYRVKQEEQVSQPHYKSRLVVKGFSQKKGIDFDEIFSLVVKCRLFM